MIVKITHPDNTCVVRDNIEVAMFEPNVEGDPLEALVFTLTAGNTRKESLQRKKEDTFAGYYVEFYSDTGSLLGTATW